MSPRLNARRRNPFRLQCRSTQHLTLLLVIAILLLLLLLLFLPSLSSVAPPAAPEAVVLKTLELSEVDDTYKTHCRFHTCFDINQCTLSLNEDILGVHIEGPYKFYTPQEAEPIKSFLSREYAELMTAIKKSRYYVTAPSAACVFIPPLDTLAQDNIADVATMSNMLGTLPGWQNGQNHLLFNMLPGQPPHYNTTPDFYYGKSMLAGAGFNPATFRFGFDIVIPVYNTLTKDEALFRKASTRPRLLSIITHGEFADLAMVKEMVGNGHGSLSLLHSPCPHITPEQLPRKRCGHKPGSTHPFPEVLLESKFCLLTSGEGRIALPDFTDMLMTGCIPVIISDNVLPFSEVLDWSMASISCLSCNLEEVVSTLEKIPSQMVLDWRNQVLFLYQRYFISMATIAITTLDVINDRVFTISAKSYDWWNRGYEVSHTAKQLGFMPIKKDEGFTIVILTFNRVKLLFEVIEKVSKAPSCVKIMVVWNNIEIDPPPTSAWPKIRQTLDIIRSKENKLSNRFFPYANLTTSAVFSLDDDITMLTIDELEFAYSLTVFMSHYSNHKTNPTTLRNLVARATPL